MVVFISECKFCFLAEDEFDFFSHLAGHRLASAFQDRFRDPVIGERFDLIPFCSDRLFGGFERLRTARRLAEYPNGNQHTDPAIAARAILHRSSSNFRAGKKKTAKCADALLGNRSAGLYN